MSRPAGVKADAHSWRRSAFAFAWATVEFARRRHCVSPQAACEQIVAQGLGFHLLENDQPDGPLYTVVWDDGVRTQQYKSGLKWVFEAFLAYAGHGDSDSLYKLYITAKRKRRSDEQLKDDSGFLLEVLNNGRRDDTLQEAMTPLEELRNQWRIGT